jgi:hypothetical protein
MSPTRAASSLLVAAVLSLATACGTGAGSGSRAVDTPAATMSTTSPTPTSTPTPTPTPTATRTASAAPTATVAPTSGNGGDDGSRSPSTAGGGVCRHLGASQVGAILGVTVRGAAVPGETGCTFDQGGSKGTSVTVLDKSIAEAGGMDGAKQEANSAVEGEPQDLSGIGEAAFVVTGSMFGGPDVNGAGAVQVRGRILSVYLEQHAGLSEAKVRSLELDLLRLVAKAGS